METLPLFIGVVFGTIGMGYLVYARKQFDGIFLAAGVGLCAFPFFVGNIWLMLLIGAALTAFPFVVHY